MGDVDVAAQHDLAPAGLELQQVGQEGFHEAEFRLLAFLPAGARGHVDRDHGKVRILHLDIAAFVIELGDAEAGDHALRLVPGVKTDTAIAFFLRIMEVAVVAMWRQERFRHVGSLCLELLDADHVGVLLAHPFEKAFLGRGADAVEVGADNP